MTKNRARRETALAASASDPVRDGAKALQNGAKKTRKVVAEAAVKDPLAVNTNDPPASVGRRKAGSKHHPDQKVLDTPDMKKVDERVKELDDACQSVLSIEGKIAEMRTKHRETNDQIGKLLDEKGLGSYIINGEQFFKKPSGERVVHQKMKLNG